MDIHSQHHCPQCLGGGRQVVLMKEGCQFRCPACQVAYGRESLVVWYEQALSTLEEEAEHRRRKLENLRTRTIAPFLRDDGIPYGPAIYVMSAPDRYAGNMLHGGLWISCLEGAEHARTAIGAFMEKSKHVARWRAQGRPVAFQIMDCENFGEDLCLPEDIPLEEACALGEAVFAFGMLFSAFWMAGNFATVRTAVDEFQKSGMPIACFLSSRPNRIPCCA